MAFTGHSGMHTAQSMHSSGSIERKFGPSRKQSTGQTSTQSVYLHRMQDSRTTWVMGDSCLRRAEAGGQLRILGLGSGDWGRHGLGPGSVEHVAPSLPAALVQ